MQITDFHIHPYLPDAEHDQCFAFYPDIAPATTEGMKAQLLESGITHVCGSVIRSDRQFDMLELNNAALKLRDILGADFYTPGFHIHPAYMEESLAEIERMHENGVKLIGELVPYIHGWSNFSERSWVPEMNTLMDAAQKHGMLLSYHTIWDWPIEPVIAAHPDMPFIAAHPGEREGVERHIERMRKYDNVYLDLSGTGIFRFGCIRYLVNKVGADRILFGTDYPICNPDMYIHAVLGERLGDDTTEKILHGNAARLLGL